MKQKVHIIPHKKGWAVKKDGKERVSKVLESKKDAETYGREMAMALKAELVIHDRHGVIQDSKSFGKDPNTPRDRK